MHGAIGEFRSRLDDELYHVEHDTDVDGFASGIITTVALRRLGFEAYPYATERSKVFVPDSGALALTDIALNNEPTAVVDAALRRGVNVYAVDHHPWTEGYRERLHATINPHYIPGVPEPSRWNTGFLTYLTFRDVAPEYAWLAAVSVYTDHCVAPWSEPLVNRYGYDRVKRTGDILTAFIATTDDLGELDYLLLNEINGIEDVLCDDRLLRAEERFESAVRKYLENPRAYAVAWDENRRLAVLQTEEPYRGINSVVSTRLSLMDGYRDWVVAVIGHDREDGVYKVSLRCQDWEKRGDMGKLASEIAAVLGGAGGGHPPAAGMRIPEEKMEEFVELLQSRL